MRFETMKDYVISVGKGKGGAVLPATIAAEVLEITPNAVKSRIKNKSIDSVQIGKSNYIPVSYLFSEIEKMERDINKIGAVLIEKAQNRQLITYGECLEMLMRTHTNPHDRAYIGQVLGGVSDRSYACNGTVLSVVAVSKKEQTPNQGFWDLMEYYRREHDDFDYDLKDRAKTLKKLQKALRKRAEELSAFFQN